MSAPAFTFPIDVAALSTKSRNYTLTADDAVREALSRELGLESLDLLKAQLSVTLMAGGVIEVNGQVEADLVQACVVTLKPVPGHLAEAIERRFVPAAPVRETEKGEVPKGVAAKREAAKREEAEEWVDPDVDAPDPIVGGIIDLGEVVTEQLALSLDPYPRAPGATFGGVADGEAGAGSTSPFAALAALKVGKAAPRRVEVKAAGGPKARPSKGKPVR